MHRWTRAEYDRIIALGLLHEDEPVELLAGRIVIKGRYPLQDRGWTRGEHAQLLAAGLLRPDEPASHSLPICSEPQGSRHATAVDLAAEVLARAFGPGFIVRTEKPLALGEGSEPEPDVAVVEGHRRQFRDAHPAHAVLIVEVADSSLELDRGAKESLYARAGIPDYWIVNLIDGVVEVHREPVPDPRATFGWRYRAREVASSGAALTPLGRATHVLVTDLLP